MDFELFKAIVDEADQYGARSFSLHLFGEPLLYPRIFDAIRYIKHKRKSHTVLLTTNGTYLERHRDSLLASSVDQVLWSWRPEAVFTQATKEKLRRWGKFRVRFIDEVTPQSAREEWADWPNVEGRKLHNYGGQIDTEKFGSQKGGNLIRLKSGETTSSPMMKSRISMEARHPCYHLWLAPAVAWNGSILICCADPHQKEVLGTFPQQTVAEVWQGDWLKAIREGHLKGEYKGICEGCDVWKAFPSMHFDWQRRKVGYVPPVE